MRRMRATLCVVVLLLGLLLTVRPALANHTPTQPANWRDPHIKKVWTQGFPNDGMRTIINEEIKHGAACVVATCNPPCYSHTCTDANGNTTGWSRWFIDQRHPHIDLDGEKTVADFDPQTSLGRDDLTITFGWRDIPSSDDALGYASPNIWTQETWVDCPGTGTLPGASVSTTQNHSATIPVGKCPGAVKKWIGACDIVFDSKIVVHDTANRPVAGFKWYVGTGDAGSREFDFWSVFSHEYGHCLGLLHYPGNDPTKANDPSTTQECTNGKDRLGEANSWRSTMCIPLYDATERQRTPETDEKDTFKNLY